MPTIQQLVRKGRTTLETNIQSQELWILVLKGEVYVPECTLPLLRSQTQLCVK
jgi:hypothetical protein